MKFMRFGIFFLAFFLLSSSIRGNNEHSVNFSIEYEKEFVAGKIVKRKLDFYVSPKLLSIDSFRKWKEKKAVCYSIEIVPGDLKKKILVIWYEKNKSHERAVFFDFPFPLIGILSFFMFEKKDNSPLDEKNDIKAVAEIMIRNIPGKDTEMLQATFFHVKRNAFFAVKTSSNTTSSLSVEKVPLCFGLLGDRKNWDASDRDSLQESR